MKWRVLPLFPFSGKISISLVLFYPKRLPDFPYEVIWDYHFICEEFFFLKKGYNFLDRKELFIFSLIPVSILMNYDFSKICLFHLNYKIYYQKIDHNTFNFKCDILLFLPDFGNFFFLFFHH